MVYIEILIVLIIIAYGWAGTRRGFLSQFFDLICLLAAFLIALRFFNFPALLFQSWGLSPNLTKPAGFFALWIFFQIIFYLLALGIFHFVPKNIESNQTNRTLGAIPGAAKGLVIISIVLMIFMILPVSPTLKDNLVKYPISGILIKSTTKVETYLKNIFGEMNILTSFNIVSENEELTKLNFKTNDYDLDESSENAMVELVNSERSKAGLKPLRVDDQIRNVARAHSIDMAQNGYFSHIDLAGRTPSDRMLTGGVNFWLTGENIALAPTYQLAEIGFMNSEKHRDNILDPNFSRIGIGIIDAGIYGRMLTQNFAN